MRLIDADELLEHLEACLQNGRPLSNLYDLSEIVHYVKSMPTIAASPWRRVKKPPEEEGRYLVASRWGKDNHWSYDLAYYTTKLEKGYFIEDGICGAGWYMWSDYEDCDICVSPDYWMPIEPPKEE